MGNRLFLWRSNYSVRFFKKYKNGLKGYRTSTVHKHFMTYDRNLHNIRAHFKENVMFIYVVTVYRSFLQQIIRHITQASHNKHHSYTFSGQMVFIGLYNTCISLCIFFLFRTDTNVQICIPKHTCSEVKSVNRFSVLLHE